MKRILTSGTRVVIVKTPGMSKDYHDYIGMEGYIKGLSHKDYGSTIVYNVLLDDYKKNIEFHSDLVKEISINLDNMFTNLDKLEQKYGKESI